MVVGIRTLCIRTLLMMITWMCKNGSFEQLFFSTAAFDLFGSTLIFVLNPVPLRTSRLDPPLRWAPSPKPSLPWSILWKWTSSFELHHSKWGWVCLFVFVWYDGASINLTLLLSMFNRPTPSISDFDAGKSSVGLLFTHITSSFISLLTLNPSPSSNLSLSSMVCCLEIRSFARFVKAFRSCTIFFAPPPPPSPP